MSGGPDFPALFRKPAEPKPTGALSDCCNAPMLTDEVMEWCEKCDRISTYYAFPAMVRRAVEQRPVRAKDGAISFLGREEDRIKRREQALDNVIKEMLRGKR